MIVVNDILTTDIDFNDTYVAIGNFDGVHYGHKKLIKEAIKAARENGKQAVVFTFEKHPMEVLFPKRKFEYINTNEEKLKPIKISFTFNLFFKILTNSKGVYSKNS